MSDNLLEVASRWLQAEGAAGLERPSRALSVVYRAGGSSSTKGIDLRAYVAARLPATLAATDEVLGKMRLLLPEWQPSSLLDLGAGPGTASWAALSHWPDLSRFDLVERAPHFRTLAQGLARQSPQPALANAAIHGLDFASERIPRPADLVVAAYSFIELPEQRLEVAAAHAWEAATHAFVLIEPGTPLAFQRLLRVRQWLIRQGAHIVAPCPGNIACPIPQPDWCHFAKRLSRSRLHMHAKQASVPFEDEKFCYLVACREPVSAAPARIIRPVRQHKAGIELSLCSANGLRARQVARRSKEAYRMARRLAWGDAMPEALLREGINDA